MKYSQNKEPDFLKNTLLFEKSISYLVIPLFFAEQILIIFYNLVAYKSKFQSDDASSNLLANEILKSHSLFPRTWFYVNGDIGLFGPHTLIAALSKLNLSPYESHAVALTIGSFMIEGALFYLGMALLDQFSKALWFPALFPLFLSAPNADQLLGEGAYTTLIIATLLNLAYIVKIAKRGSKGIPRVSSWLVPCVSFIALTSSPSKSMIYFVLPFSICAALIFIEYKKDKNNKRIHISWLINRNLIGIFLGSITHLIILPSLHNSNSVLAFPFRNPGDSFEGVRLIFNIFAWGQGINPGNQYRSTSLMGLFSVFHFIVFIIFCYLIKKILNMSKTLKMSPSNCILVFAIPSLLINIYSIIFTQIGVDISNYRYLLIPVILLTYLVIMFLFENLGEDISKIFLSMIIISTICNFPNLFVYDKSAQNQNKLILSELNLSGYKVIYSTYWNASKLEILDAEKIQFRPVNWSSVKCIEPFEWLTAESHTPKIVGSIYMLVQGSELPNLQSASCKGRIETTQHYDNYDLVRIKF